MSFSLVRKDNKSSEPATGSYWHTQPYVPSTDPQPGVRTVNKGKRIFRDCGSPSPHLMRNLSQGYEVRNSNSKFCKTVLATHFGTAEDELAYNMTRSWARTNRRIV
jgi:hypothetical protein